MLSQKTLDAIAELYGITADVLAQNISDEQEIALDLPEGRFLSSEQEATLLDNHGKSRYDAGVSKATKDAFDGKSKEDFLKEIKSAALEEAKIEPNKKVAELQSSIETLQKQVTDKEDAYSNLETKMKQKELKLGVQALFPTLPDTLGINGAEATSLFLMNHEVKEDGIYKNGTLLKDNLQNPLSQADAVKAFVAEKGWDAAPGGRGGGAGGSGGTEGGKIKTMEAYEAHLKEKGLQVGSAEANALLDEIAKESPEILD